MCWCPSVDSIFAQADRRYFVTPCSSILSQIVLSSEAETVMR